MLVEPPGGYTVIKGFVVGLLVGVLLLIGGVYYYFASGMAPVATSDGPMPYEKKMASISKNAHIRKQMIPPPPLPPDEPNLVEGAKVYKEQCATCHGLPNQPPPTISDNMYPHAPLLFKGKGVTDDPPGETHWTITNGIRLTGMPSFKDTLTDTQLWQVAQLLANADKISDSVKGVVAPTPTMVMPAGRTSPR
jgi:thiosulfate dehydrogenase